MKCSLMLAICFILITPLTSEPLDEIEAKKHVINEFKKEEVIFCGQKIGKKLMLG
tara:strand:- start:348 stop:512 length:165 start_codon:yes stop_codon:yes gene_type:complete